MLSWFCSNAKFKDIWKDREQDPDKKKADEMMVKSNHL